MLEIATTLLSQWPRRLHRLRKASSFARSAAVQVPDHAGVQYVIFARTVDRNTSCSDTVGIPRQRNTRRANNRLLHDDNKLFTWSVALSWSHPGVCECVVVSYWAWWRTLTGWWLLSRLCLVYRWCLRRHANVSWQAAHYRSTWVHRYSDCLSLGHLISDLCPHTCLA